MKTQRIVVLAISVCAAISAWALSRGIVAPEESAQALVVQEELPVEDVLVAARTIAPGEILSEEDLSWQSWPAVTISSGLITEAEATDALTDIPGGVARSEITAGEPIKMRELAFAGEGGFLAAKLKDDRRAMSVPISPETAAAGFILPGDRVDVLVTERLTAAGADEFVSRTALRNLPVLAIDQTASEQTGPAIVGDVATLEVSPVQAERLARLVSQGEITLSLRSILDQDVAARIADAAGRTVEVVEFGVPRKVVLN